MALDRCLAREIKRAAPDRRDREAYFAFVGKLRDACDEMSCTDVLYHFNDMLNKHGRVVTAIVIAATLWSRMGRLDGWKLNWAIDVNDCWQHTEYLLSEIAIRDELHPSRICEYAGSFIRATEER